MLNHTVRNTLNITEPCYVCSLMTHSAEEPFPLYPVEVTTNTLGPAMAVVTVTRGGSFGQIECIKHMERIGSLSNQLKMNLFRGALNIYTGTDRRRNCSKEHVDCYDNSTLPLYTSWCGKLVESQQKTSLAQVVPRTVPFTNKTLCWCRGNLTEGKYMGLSCCRTYVYYVNQSTTDLLTRRGSADSTTGQDPPMPLDTLSFGETSFTTSVVSCRPAELKIDKSGKKEKVKGFNIILKDTILFPEGGGQPDDQGVLNDIPVLRVTRQGADAVHFVTSPLEEGVEVQMKVDWERRFNHMQQHSGQHLITAIADSMFGFKTTSWKDGDNEFMNIIANEIGTEGTLIFLTVGDEKEAGLFLLAGPIEMVDTLGPRAL
ncbi:UNVERIFIED_CONTAM: hypothetical protein FKN15_004515 [Acipenser sinensis]